MSYAILTVIHGVPLNQDVSDHIRALEEECGDLFEGGGGTCGFTTLYSASGTDLVGYCGVKLCTLPSYDSIRVGSIPTPSQDQKDAAEKLVSELDLVLRDLAGPIDTYIVWSDS